MAGNVGKMGGVLFRPLPDRPSGSIAADPDERHKGRDQADEDQHPVLAFEAQNGEVLHEKMHRSRLVLGKIGVLNKEIYYFYLSPRNLHPGVLFAEGSI